MRFLCLIFAALLLTACDSEPSGSGLYHLSEKEGRSGFTVEVEEGNHAVTLRFGHPSQATATWVKAEARRWMLDEVKTAAGEFVERTIVVNIRRPLLQDGGRVGLKGADAKSANWDDDLSLEFSGSVPSVASVQIQPAGEVTTVFVAGDSTVCDYDREPHAGWGQMLPRFFGPQVAVANHARSGLALHTFQGSRRLEKVLEAMKPGDYFLIQFGHNDQKDRSEGAGPFTSFKRHLKHYINETRKAGGIPVLVTPMERRRFLPDGTQIETLTEFAAATRQVGHEEKVPVIDLHAMSLKLYGALGPERSKLAFLHLPANALPGQTEALRDDSHHSTFGAYQLARCVVEGIKAKVPELAKLIAADAGSFDPAQPDDPEHFRLPASPITGRAETPDGN